MKLWPAAGEMLCWPWLSVEVAKFNDIYPWGTLLLIPSACPSKGKGVGLHGLLLYCPTPESLRDSQGETTWPKFSKGPPSPEVSFQSSLLPCHHRHSHPGCHWDAEWTPHPWGLMCWETVLWSSLLKIPITHGVVVQACHPGPWEGEAEPLSAAQAT